MPALAELPMIKVVHPAYHCLPNGGHGSFWPAANLRLSCVLVLATAAHVRVFAWESNRPSRGSQRTFGRVCDCCRSRDCVSDCACDFGGQSSPISTAPAVAPARMDRRALGPLTAGCASSLAGADDIVVVYLVCRGLAAVVGGGPGFRFRTFGSGLRRQEPAADWGPADGRAMM